MIARPQPSPRTSGAVRRHTARVLLRIFVPVAAVVLCAVLALCFWAGYFDRVRMSRETVGPYHLLYREHRGPYEGIRFAMRDVFLYYRDTYEQTPACGFSVYEDDAGITERDSLRSRAGCLTDTLLVDPDAPFRSRTVPEYRAAVGTFPLRSPFSYMVGVMKHRRALQRFLDDEGLERGGAVMEIYDMEKREIRYVTPVGEG